jgi:uncharacterized protein with FMN-binding domain
MRAQRALAVASLGAAASTSVAGLAAPAIAAAATKSVVYKGATAQTQWGPVIVTLTVSKKKITKISVSATPHTPRSQQLQSFAIPVLRSEALKAQSWRVNVVSGATITSDGFATSMYSAMKHAHLL